MLNIPRIFRHLLTTHWQVRHTFPPSTLDSIEQEIQACEVMHNGEIRFVVEGALSGGPLYLNQAPRERAIDLFSQLRMWDTEHRNGILIYLLLADRAVEIVADRGVHAKTGTPEWQRICLAMENAFRAGRYQRGTLDGIREVNRLLSQQFPLNGRNRNELPNKVLVL